MTRKVNIFRLWRGKIFYYVSNITAYVSNTIWMDNQQLFFTRYELRRFLVNAFTLLWSSRKAWLLITISAILSSSFFRRVRKRGKNNQGCDQKSCLSDISLTLSIYVHFRRIENSFLFYLSLVWRPVMEIRFFKENGSLSNAIFP